MVANDSVNAQYADAMLRFTYKKYTLMIIISAHHEIIPVNFTGIIVLIRQSISRKAGKLLHGIIIVIAWSGFYNTNTYEKKGGHISSF